MPSKPVNAKNDPQVLVYSENPNQRLLDDGVKEAAEADLFFFTKYVLGRDKLVERTHGPLCQFLQRPCEKAWKRGSNKMTDLYGLEGLGVDWQGESVRDFPRVTRPVSDAFIRAQLLMLPRGSYKSTICSEALPLWILINRPNAKVMVAAQSQGDAVKRLTTMELLMRQSPQFQRIWGKWWEDSPRWERTDKIVNVRNRADSTPSMSAVSPGVWKPGAHPDYIIFDDILDEKTVESDVEMERVHQFFETVQPALTDPACQWVVGTPYGELDLYAELQGEKFRKLFEIYIRSAYNPDGSLWLPEVVNETTMAFPRATLGPYFFSTQYLLKVVPRSERSFNATDIHFDADTKTPARELLNVLLFIDPADARGSGSSEWAVSVIGVDENKDFWDIDSFKAKAQASTVTDEVIRLVRKHKPNVVLCENTGFSRSFMDATLKPGLQRANLRVQVVEMTPANMSKQFRIMDIENGLGSVISQKRFHMRESNFAGKLEIQSFPGDRSFDWLDATSYIVRWVGEKSFYPRHREAKPDVKLHPEVQAWYAQCNRALKRRDSVAKTYVAPGIYTRCN